MKKAVKVMMVLFLIVGFGLNGTSFSQDASFDSDQAILKALKDEMTKAAAQLNELTMSLGAL